MKKKFYLVAAWCSIVFFANAQIKKGEILLGGGVNYNTSSAGSTGKTNSFYISPSVGRAVQDNLIVGLNLNYSHVGQDKVYKSNSYGGSVFARKYRPLGNSGFSIYVEGSLGGTYNKATSNQPVGVTSNKTKGYRIGANASPGVAYRISKRVMVETGFANLLYANYSHVKTSSYDAGSPGSTLSTGTDHTFSIGSQLSSALNNFIVGFRFVI